MTIRKENSMKDFLLSDIAFANKTLGIQGYNKKKEEEEEGGNNCR